MTFLSLLAKRNFENFISVINICCYGNVFVRFCRNYFILIFSFELLFLTVLISLVLIMMPVQSKAIQGPPKHTCMSLVSGQVGVLFSFNENHFIK